jgi:protein-disulfide isomerase
MKKLIFIIATFVFIISESCGKKDAIATGATVEKESGAGEVISLDKAAKEKLISYLRKALNVPEQYNMELLEPKASKIKGLSTVPGKVTFQGRSQDFEIYVSSDGKYVLVGKLFDITGSPYEKRDMSAVNLKKEDVNSKGPDDAPVTIVEYSDFQCPYCSKAYQTIENEVLKKYGKKVRFIFKHFPLDFHPWAMNAAIASECAALQKKDAFWKLYSNFFEKQTEINPDNLKTKVIEWIAKEGLDKTQFEKCYDGKETKAKVEKDRQEGMSIGVSGTPGFFVNGVFLGGAMPAEKFKEVIEYELSNRS